MRVGELLTRWRWEPIRHCAGRYVLAGADPRLSLEGLLGHPCRVQTYTTPKTRDTVLVVSLDDGGMISYARDDGTLVHTLNTAEGFARKLGQLGIRLADGPNTTSGVI